MQLSPIPASTIARNQKVVTGLDAANVKTLAAEHALESGDLKSVARDLKSALKLAEKAEGVAQALTGATNLLDGAAHRYASHAVRELGEAVGYVSRAGSSKDALALLERSIFDAEVATRLGRDAGVRSLEHPKVRTERPTSGGGDGGGSTGGTGGGTWVDGEYLDEIGNPVRGGGGGEWAGPDGERYGSDGSPVDSGDGGGWDGGGYTGI